MIVAVPCNFVEVIGGVIEHEGVWCVSRIFG